jgi:hypothetical protein
MPECQWPGPYSMGNGSWQASTVSESISVQASPVWGSGSGHTSTKKESGNGQASPICESDNGQALGYGKMEKWEWQTSAIR